VKRNLVFGEIYVMKIGKKINFNLMKFYIKIFLTISANFTIANLILNKIPQP